MQNNISKVFNVLGITRDHLGQALVAEVMREQSDKKVVKALLTVPTSAWMKKKFIDNAFLVAAMKKKTGLCRILLDNGANIETQNVDGDTALGETCRYNDVKTARLLLSRGADPNVQGKYGVTPLIQASYWGGIDLVKDLVGRGARVDAKTRSGNTAIETAEGAGHEQVVKFLKAAMTKAPRARQKKQPQPAQ
ncbi:MAG: ankyrin repeat domain-containing protein [Alphaproteobacteria bacterium]